ncbi:MAG: type IV pilin protein [Thiotrichales bacterium]|nr:type IV pilin protein [Thiotrichales bacterium]
MSILVGVPLAGHWLLQRDVSAYLVLPHATQAYNHAPFSWPAWTGMALFVAAMIGSYLFIVMRSRHRQRTLPEFSPAMFPWWGTFGILLTILGWILAWTRFPWFSDLQVFTFTPLWCGYIITVNAADANDFTATATYQNGDDEATKCASFTIDGRGTKTSAPLADCWTRTR